MAFHFRAKTEPFARNAGALAPKIGALPFLPLSLCEKSRLVNSPEIGPSANEDPSDRALAFGKDLSPYFQTTKTQARLSIGCAYLFLAAIYWGEFLAK